MLAPAAADDSDTSRDTHLTVCGKMLGALCGAMSIAELGIYLAKMIHKNKGHAIVYIGTNLRKNTVNLVAGLILSRALGQQPG